jgi:hypothetical protein
MAAAKKTYWEKLKDPRWQKKRLEVLEANEFTCQCCFDTESTLHVHHKEYFKGREPWEYEIKQLAVLCEACHETTHEYLDPLKYVSSYLDFDGPLDRSRFGIMLAGHARLDYESLLAACGLDDCAIHRALYDLGVRIDDLPFDWRSFQDESEKNDG